MNCLNRNECKMKKLKDHIFPQGPNVLIGLYNTLIDHMADILTMPELEDISWPPPELVPSKTDVLTPDWNSKHRLSEVYELLTNLRLPWFHYKDNDATDWSSAVHDIWTFVNAVVKKRCDSSVSLTTRLV